MNLLRKTLYPCLCLALLLSLCGQAIQPALAAVAAKAESAAQAEPQSVMAPEPSAPTDTLADLATNVKASNTALTSAYVRDFDLGNGQRMALVSSAPVNYQAEDGSWQPIDARFQAISGGFANPTNLLKIVAAENHAALGLESAGQKITWVSDALVWIGAGGQELTLARPRDPALAGAASMLADGSALRYDSSWDQAGLSEVIAAGPGSVETSLVLASAPALPANLPWASLPPSAFGGDALLVQRALLRLPDGAELFANRATQTGEFGTTGEVQVRDARGQTLLIMAAPSAFEQANPAERVAATYRFSPIDASTWRVEIRTPWRWWQAAGRQYPAIIDPTMRVFRHTQSVQASTTGQVCTGNNDPLDADAILKGDGFMYVGIDPACPENVHRILVRFLEFPTLPPNAVLSEATLLAAPVGAYYHPFNPPTDGSAPIWINPSAVAEVHKVTYFDWSQWTEGDIQQIYLFNYTRSEQVMDTDTLFISAPLYRNLYSMSYFVLDTALVNQWMQDEESNYGLELRLQGDQDATDNAHHRFTFPPVSFWTKADRDKGNNINAGEGGGFMLALTYTPPTLTEGTPTDSDVPSYEPDVFGLTSHAYQMPNGSGHWEAAAVKGLTYDMLPGDVRVLRAAGNPGLTASSGLSSTGRFGEQSNYILYPGDTTVSVEPFDLENSTRNPEFYRLEARSAQPFGDGSPFTSGSVRTETVVFSSTETLRLFDLNLVAGTEVSVFAEYKPSLVQVRMFPPSSTGHTKGSNLARKDPIGPEKITADDDGTWALAVEWPKDATCMYNSPNDLWCPLQQPTQQLNQPAVDQSPFNVQATITVVACTAGQIASPAGCINLDAVDCDITPRLTVGQYNVYSPQGDFTTDGTYQYSAGNLAYIGPNTCVEPVTRLVAVVGNPVKVRTTSPQSLTQDGGQSTRVYLARWSNAGVPVSPSFQVWQGGLSGWPGGAQDGWIIPGGTAPYIRANLPLDSSEMGQTRINMAGQYVEYQALLMRTVAVLERTNPSAKQTFNFNFTWQVRQEGYGTTPYSADVTYQSGSSQAEIGSLDVRIENANWQVDFAPGDPGMGAFTDLRTTAKLVLPSELGSAWKPAQFVIQADNIRLDATGQPFENRQYCPAANCFDVRHATNDRAGHIDRTWEMPDITVAGEAQTVIFNEPGAMHVYSSDHPDGLDDVSVGFNFRTFQTTVTVSRGTCPSNPGGGEVTLFNAHGLMALPGLGSDTNQGPQVETDFVLCETALDGLSLSLAGMPPIPVGTTGLFITGLSGEFKRVAPGGDVSITLDVDYAADASGTLTDGTASVTIDTRGLFDIQVKNGTIAKLVSYNGHAWVGWDPLDMGVSVHAWLNLWVLRIDSQASGHIWQGQGWQGQYNWLPANDEMHMTASLSTSFTIPDGALLDEWWVTVPDGDWTLELPVAVKFGQFHCDCNNGYEWGIQVPVRHPVYTLGFTIGVYVGFDSGLDIVLGSSDNKLIDQPALALLAQNDPALLPQTLKFAPETAYISGQPIAVERAVYPGAGAPQADVPLTVPENASGLMVSLGWQKLADSPTLMLIRPDGVEITSANVTAYGGSYSARPNERSGPNVPPKRVFSLPNPMEGNWQIRITGATTESGWKLGYAINQDAPALQLTTPATPNQAWEQDTPYVVRWNVAATVPNPETLAVNLYYTATLTEGGERSGSIVQDVAYADGQYAWDMSYLPEGTYVVTGELVYPTVDGFPQHYSAGQTIPWLIDNQRFAAAGTIVLSDSSAPGLVTGVNVVKLDQALMVCWDPNPAHDLEGYLLFWASPDVDGNLHQHVLNVRADVPYPPVPDWKQQCARIGGLNAGDVVGDVSVAAYDINGRISARTAPIFGNIVEDGQPDAAPAPGTLSASYDPFTHRIRLTWTGATDPTKVAGYLVYFAVDKAAGPGQMSLDVNGDPSPIDVGNRTNYTIYGLPVGHRGYFVVQAYDAEHRLGSISNSVSKWVTNGIDDDDNGIPDDWEGAWGLDLKNPDPDKDGLPYFGDPYNEYDFGTNPLDPDTDHDGYSDGQEISSRTDPLDPADFPSLEAWPRLMLETDFLHFNAGTAGAPPPDQLVGLYNTGGGTLNLAITSNADWLTASIVDGAIQVHVNPTGLGRGEYHARLTVSAAVGAHVTNAPQTINVELLVYEGALYPWKVYIPLAQK